MLQIEPNVPVPHTRTKYPFADMLPGDSIFFSDYKKANAARVSTRRFMRLEQPHWKFLLRRVREENGWRLWRVV